MTKSLHCQRHKHKIVHTRKENEVLMLVRKQKKKKTANRLKRIYIANL